jgi:hypothetical protein
MKINVIRIMKKKKKEIMSIHKLNTKCLEKKSYSSIVTVLLVYMNNNNNNYNTTNY